MAGEDDDQAGFDKILDQQEATGRTKRLDDAPPIGMNPNGSINEVKKGARREEPTVLADETEEPDETEGGEGNTDVSDLDDIDAAVVDA